MLYIPGNSSPLHVFSSAGQLHQWVVEQGLLALAGLIDTGYGLDQAVNGKTSDDRAQGMTRTVFGLLNALPLAGAGKVLRGETADAGNRASLYRDWVAMGRPIPIDSVLNPQH